MAKQPSRDDPSKPKAHGYAYKKQFYQSADVAADYDEHRFRTPKRQRRNARKWAAIQKALALTDRREDRSSICPAAPAGSPAISRARVIRWWAATSSVEMMQQAAKLRSVSTPTSRGYVRADAGSAAVPHEVRRLPDEHPLSCFTSTARRARRMLREFGRVSRGAGSSPTIATSIRARYGVWKLSTHAWVSRSGRSSAYP